jgi:general secretion pathway protein C
MNALMAGMLHHKARQYFLRFAPGLALLVMLLALGAQLAHWTWALFAPSAPIATASPAQTDLAGAGSGIASAHLFGVSSQPLAAPSHDGAGLNIQLKGVFASVGRRPSYAIVNSGGKTDLTVRAGDEIQPGIILKSVYPRHVVLSREGVLLRIDLAQKDAGLSPQQPGATRLGISPIGYNAYRISRSDLSAALQPQNADAHNPANPGLNLGKLGAAPSGGVQVMEAASGSLAEKLGLQPGDVLRQINGQYVSTLADLSRIYQQLQQASQIQLELVRSGKPMQLRYTVQQ